MQFPSTAVRDSDNIIDVSSDKAEIAKSMTPLSEGRTITKTHQYHIVITSKPLINVENHPGFDISDGQEVDGKGEKDISLLWLIRASLT